MILDLHIQIIGGIGNKKQTHDFTIYSQTNHKNLIIEIRSTTIRQMSKVDETSVAKNFFVNLWAIWNNRYLFCQRNRFQYLYSNCNETGPFFNRECKMAKPLKDPNKTFTRLVTAQHTRFTRSLRNVKCKVTLKN